jgi:hypothetical protein
MAHLISQRLGQGRRKLQRGSEGFLMMAGILAALGMVLGTVALVNLNLSRLRGSKQLNDSRDAKSVAEAGLNQILATLNRPENRGLLVAGIAMGQRSNSANNNAIRSPCVNTSGVRPGASGDGIPTSSARTYGDGQYRDVSCQWPARNHNRLHLDDGSGARLRGQLYGPNRCRLPRRDNLDQPITALNHADIQHHVLGANQRGSSLIRAEAIRLALL